MGALPPQPSREIAAPHAAWRPPRKLIRAAQEAGDWGPGPGGPGPASWVGGAPTNCHLPPISPGAHAARRRPGHRAQAGGRICSFGAMNQARPLSPLRSASGIRSLPGSKIIWAKLWEVCVRALRGEGGGAGRAGCAGLGEVPSDSPAVVRTELTLLSFPLTAASTARKLNPLAAWRGRGTESVLLRARPRWGPGVYSLLRPVIAVRPVQLSGFPDRHSH